MEPANHIQTEPLRLHLGGEQIKAGWKIVNIQPGSGVDFVGDAKNLGQFKDATVDDIYASHVYEHLSYTGDVQQAFREAFRVLKPGGLIRIAVPDLDRLCRLYLTPGLAAPQRFYLMRVLVGGQTNPFDYHKCLFDEETLTVLLRHTGFVDIQRVDAFGLFEDTSLVRFMDTPFSLNVQARKP